MTIETPFTFTIPFPQGIPSCIDTHIQRRLSSLSGQFLDNQAFETMLQQGDPVIYDVYQIRRPEIAGELLMGVSMVHPGKVGNEFFMTKGHFHAILETAETYIVLKGEGYMVMETPEGDCSVETLSPGKALYIPPRWAHRAVCTARQEDLVFLFICPGNSGHDYGTIEQQGFRKLVIETEKGIEILDNPRWRCL